MGVKPYPFPIFPKANLSTYKVKCCEPYCSEYVEISESEDSYVFCSYDCEEWMGYFLENLKRKINGT